MEEDDILLKGILAKRQKNAMVGTMQPQYVNNGNGGTRIELPQCDVCGATWPELRDSQKEGEPFNPSKRGRKYQEEYLASISAETYVMAPEEHPQKNQAFFRMASRISNEAGKRISKEGETLTEVMIPGICICFKCSHRMTEVALQKTKHGVSIECLFVLPVPWLLGKRLGVFPYESLRHHAGFPAHWIEKRVTGSAGKKKSVLQKKPNKTDLRKIASLPIEKRVDYYFIWDKPFRDKVLSVFKETALPPESPTTIGDFFAHTIISTIDIPPSIRLDASSLRVSLYGGLPKEICQHCLNNAEIEFDDDYEEAAQEAIQEAHAESAAAGTSRKRKSREEEQEELPEREYEDGELVKRGINFSKLTRICGTLPSIDSLITQTSRLFELMRAVDCFMDNAETIPIDRRLLMQTYQVLLRALRPQKNKLINNISAVGYMIQEEIARVLAGPLLMRAAFDDDEIIGDGRPASILNVFKRQLKYVIADVRDEVESIRPEWSLPFLNTLNDIQGQVYHLEDLRAEAKLVYQNSRGRLTKLQKGDIGCFEIIKHSFSENGTMQSLSAPIREFVAANFVYDVERLKQFAAEFPDFIQDDPMYRWKPRPYSSFDDDLPKEVISGSPLLINHPAIARQQVRAVFLNAANSSEIAQSWAGMLGRPQPLVVLERGVWFPAGRKLAIKNFVSVETVALLEAAMTANSLPPTWEMSIGIHVFTCGPNALVQILDTPIPLDRRGGESITRRVGTLIAANMLNLEHMNSPSIMDWLEEDSVSAHENLSHLRALCGNFFDHLVGLIRGTAAIPTVIHVLKQELSPSFDDAISPVHIASLDISDKNKRNSFRFRNVAEFADSVKIIEKSPGGIFLDLSEKLIEELLSSAVFVKDTNANGPLLNRSCTSPSLPGALGAMLATVLRNPEITVPVLPLSFFEALRNDSDYTVPMVMEIWPMTGSALLKMQTGRVGFYEGLGVVLQNHPILRPVIQELCPDPCHVEFAIRSICWSLLTQSSYALEAVRISFCRFAGLSPMSLKRLPPMSLRSLICNIESAPGLTRWTLPANYICLDEILREWLTRLIAQDELLATSLYAFITKYSRVFFARSPKHDELLQRYAEDEDALTIKVPQSINSFVEFCKEIGEQVKPVVEIDQDDELKQWYAKMAKENTQLAVEFTSKLMLVKEKSVGEIRSFVIRWDEEEQKKKKSSVGRVPISIPREISDFRSFVQQIRTVMDDGLQSFD